MMAMLMLIKRSIFTSSFQVVSSCASAQFASLASILPDSKKGYILSKPLVALLHKPERFW